MADSKKLQYEYVKEEIRRSVAEGTGDLLRAYFKKELGDWEWSITQARQEYEGSLAEFGKACETLRDEAQRRGIELRKPLLPATAGRRKAANGETGQKAVKRSARKA